MYEFDDKYFFSSLKEYCFLVVIQFLLACIISFLPNSLFRPYSFFYRGRSCENKGNIYNKFFKVNK